MIIVDNDIKQLADEIASESIQKAECYPVDRYFLELYLDRIKKVDSKKFLLYSLENLNNTYTVQLMLCLPELWADIEIDDIIEVMNSFTNPFSFYCLITFTYKYLEIDIIDLILKGKSISDSFKFQIKKYLKAQYINLFKSEGEIFVIDESLLGINNSDWVYIKQKLLLDVRVTPALQSIDELEKYVKRL